MLGGVHSNERVLTGLRWRRVEAVRCWIEGRGGLRATSRSDVQSVALRRLMMSLQYGELSVRTREWHGQLSCLGETDMPTEGCCVVGIGVFVAGGRLSDDHLGYVEELPCDVLMLDGGGTRCLAVGKRKRWTLVLGGSCPLKSDLELPSSF